MILNKPSFSISFTFEDTISLIEKLIKKRRWTGFSVADVKLTYYPYWTFRYSVFVEKEDEKENRKVTEELGSGRHAVDALTGELNEKIISVMEKSGLEIIKEPKENYPFEVIKPEIEEKEVKQILPLKIASLKGTTKDHVILSNIKLVYLPVWDIGVTIEDKNHRLEVNAVTGEIYNEEEVLERERGWIEITNETLSDLKNPGAWVKYSGDIIGSASPMLGSGFRDFFTSRMFWVLLLILLIILLALSLLGVF